MKKKNFSIKLFFNASLPLLLIFLLIGCNAVPQNPPEEEGNNSPEVPEILEEMEEAVLNIMYDIDALEGIKIAMAEEEIDEIDQPSNIDVEVEGDLEGEISINGEGEEKEEENEEEEQSNQQEEESVATSNVGMLVEENAILYPLFVEEEIEGEAIAIEEPPTDLDSIWFAINNQMEELHNRWNVLEADLRDVNAPQSEITEFEEVLTNATLFVSAEEDRSEILLSLNELTRHLANFRNSFTGKVPGEVYKMSYHLRHSMIDAYNEEYDEAGDHITQIKEIKSSLQQELTEKNAEHVSHKFDLSIEDLERQLAIEDFHLIQIEGGIVMKNIVLIEDTFRGSVH